MPGGVKAVVLTKETDRNRQLPAEAIFSLSRCLGASLLEKADCGPLIWLASRIKLDQVRRFNGLVGI